MCKFKKEKNGVKIYTVKEGRIPDALQSGTGLPVARIGEAVIQAPIEQVGVAMIDTACECVFLCLRVAWVCGSGVHFFPVRPTELRLTSARQPQHTHTHQVAALWWFFNSRADWDKANTLASEVVEEYGPNERLVYIKGACCWRLDRRRGFLEPTTTIDSQYPPPSKQAPPSP